MFKRILCGLLATLCLTATLASCKGDSSQSGDNTQSGENSEAVTDSDDNLFKDAVIPEYSDVGLPEKISSAFEKESIFAGFKDRYTYFLADKVQYKVSVPIYRYSGSVFVDIEKIAELFGFDYTYENEVASLTYKNATLKFSANKNSVDINGTEYSFPTVIKTDNTLIASADYLARWLGYEVFSDDDFIYITDDKAKYESDPKAELQDRYRMYEEIIYNYDDVECEKTDVGKYDKTPYEDRLVGIAYTTWNGSSANSWSEDGTWSTPLYGTYKSTSKEVIYRHGIQLRDAGVDFIFVDWSNNTGYDPATMSAARSDFRMIEKATDKLFSVWSTIENAPKICIFAGPGHNGPSSVANGQHQKKVDQIYNDYVTKYPDLYFNYEGKPLLMCYGATPNLYGSDPSWDDSRFTVRWLTGYIRQQSGLIQRNTLRSNKFWSWEERGTQTYTVINNRVECVTVSASTRPEGESGTAELRDNGATLKRKFQRANDLGAGLVLVVSWNEWVIGEQISEENSKDIEPSVAFGTFYYDLLCEQIKKYKGQLD